MDRELVKISRILKRVDELEVFMYTSADNFSPSEMARIRKYIGSRKKYFFDWFYED